MSGTRAAEIAALAATHMRQTAVCIEVRDAGCRQPRCDWIAAVDGGAVVRGADGRAACPRCGRHAVPHLIWIEPKNQTAPGAGTPRA